MINTEPIEQELRALPNREYVNKLLSDINKDLDQLREYQLTYQNIPQAQSRLQVLLKQHAGIAETKVYIIKIIQSLTGKRINYLEYILNKVSVLNSLSSSNRDNALTQEIEDVIKSIENDNSYIQSITTIMQGVEGEKSDLEKIIYNLDMLQKLEEGRVQTRNDFQNISQELSDEDDITEEIQAVKTRAQKLLDQI